MTRLATVKSFVAALVLVPALAHAQPKTADEWYKEGETLYNLGEFEKAAEAFKQGFATEQDESKKAAYLYNVAQSYRQGHKCADAAFFFKRYLALKDQDTAKPLRADRRAEIEKNIAELEECAKTQPATTVPGTTPKPGPGPGTKPGPGPGTKPGPGPGTKPEGATKPGPATKPPGPTASPGTGAQPGSSVAQRDEGEDEEEDDEEDEVGVSDAWVAQPQLVSARFLTGGSRVGAGDLDVGVRGRFALIGGYPVFVQDQLVVEAGAAFAYTPVAYRNQMTTAGSMASLVSVLANGAATYAVAPNIAVRGDLGLGILTFGGLDMGDPFTERSVGTTGPLTMFALRIGVSGDYQITPNIVATATPFAFSYSPAKAGLRSDISAITQIEFMVGVGYKM